MQGQECSAAGAQALEHDARRLGGTHGAVVPMRYGWGLFFCAWGNRVVAPDGFSPRGRFTAVEVPPCSSWSPRSTRQRP
jgi:hypothetical protein